MVLKCFVTLILLTGFQMSDAEILQKAAENIRIEMCSDADTQFVDVSLNSVSTCSPQNESISDTQKKQKESFCLVTDVLQKKLARLGLIDTGDTNSVDNSIANAEVFGNSTRQATVSNAEVHSQRQANDNSETNMANGWTDTNSPRQAIDNSEAFNMTNDRTPNNLSMQAPDNYESSVQNGWTQGPSSRQATENGEIQEAVLNLTMDIQDGVEGSTLQCILENESEMQNGNFEFMTDNPEFMSKLMAHEYRDRHEISDSETTCSQISFSSSLHDLDLTSDLDCSSPSSCASQSRLLSEEIPDDDWTEEMVLRGLTRAYKAATIFPELTREQINEKLKAAYVRCIFCCCHLKSDFIVLIL